MTGISITKKKDSYVLTTQTNLLPLKVERGNIVRVPTERDIDGYQHNHFRIHGSRAWQVDAESLYRGGNRTNAGNVQVRIDQSVLVCGLHGNRVGELWTQKEMEN